MKIEHLAIWTRDIERLASFYERYFGAQPGPLYTNESTQFRSRFLTFESGARLELMQRRDVQAIERSAGQEFLGYAHLALSAGSEAQVDSLTRRLVGDGHRLLDGPRWTGDGYYESVVLDPDANRVEITV